MRKGMHDLKTSFKKWPGREYCIEEELSFSEKIVKYTLHKENENIWILD